VWVTRKNKAKNKEWFDEEYPTVNEEKNCARARAFQIQNRTRAAKLAAMNEYRQAPKMEKKTCLEIKKGNSTIRLLSKLSDITVFRTPAYFVIPQRNKKAVQTCSSNVSSCQDGRNILNNIQTRAPKSSHIRTKRCELALFVFF
jgi:hypothetical protein